MVTILHVNLPVVILRQYASGFLSELTGIVTVTVGYHRSIACLAGGGGSATKTLPSRLDNTGSYEDYGSMALWLNNTTTFNITTAQPDGSTILRVYDTTDLRL